MLVFHGLFFFWAVASFAILIYFNRRKPVFLFTGNGSGLHFNKRLQTTLQPRLFKLPGISKICVFIPLNLGLFLFLPQPPPLNPQYSPLASVYFGGICAGRKLTSFPSPLPYISPPTALTSIH